MDPGRGDRPQRASEAVEPGRTFSRRALLRASAVGAAALATGAALPAVPVEADVTQDEPLAAGGYGLNQDWLFGGVYTSGAEQPGYPDDGDATVTLPHTVTALSWSDWAPSTWEKVWIYRKHLSAAAVSGGRVFVDFQGVMTSATVWCNGTQLGVHQGGYLPFGVELTGHLVAGDNVLAVAVDGTLQDVPPDNPAGDAAIDYLQPAGIYRDVSLRIVPEVFVSDVFAQPTNVLAAGPGLDALVTLDVGAVPGGPVSVTAAVTDATGRTLGSATRSATLTQTGPTQLTLSIAAMSGISLWSPESPTLYGVQVTVTASGGASHTFTARTGFRDAQFRPDGFYLNGTRYQIFGLNRHQHFPYVGGAAAARLQRRDAQLLKQLNCNMVRCSHYPQSDWFLDACDELGIMVWQEPPGWQYVGQDAQFQGLVLQNVSDMIVRDRSRPSVIVWATRLNETTTLSTRSTGPANAALYDRTDALAASLDGTRQTTGAMNDYSTDGWHQQVFAYDDYTNDGNSNATLRPPITLDGQAIPYLISESVGALDGAPLYRWIDSSATLTLQARLHAQVHSQAGAAGYAGLLGWAGIDYATLNGASTSAPQLRSAATTGSVRVWRNLKTCGVMDPFRAVKPGGAFYGSQRATAGDSFVTPAFTWDPGGPAQNAMLLTDCAAVRVSTVSGSATSVVATVTPDAGGYPHLLHPPAFVSLPAVAGVNPDLLLEGLSASGETVATARMSATVSGDRLSLTADDAQIAGDGTDATRVTARVLDAYGNQRRIPDGTVALRASGPAALHTDPSFDLSSYGGVTGGILVSAAGGAGTVTVVAVPSQAGYGTRTVTVQVGGDSPSATSVGTGGVRVLNPEAVVAAPVTAPAASPQSAVTAAAGASHRPAARVSAAVVRDRLRDLLRIRGAAARMTRVIRHGDEVSFLAPGAGSLVIGWYAQTRVAVSGHPHRTRTRRVLVATATAHIHHAGRARVRVHLTARGRTLLRRDRARHVTLLAEASFTPRGGRRVTASRHITLTR